jgi:hypothetical protein
MDALSSQSLQVSEEWRTLQETLLPLWPTFCLADIAVEAQDAL